MTELDGFWWNPTGYDWADPAAFFVDLSRDGGNSIKIRGQESLNIPKTVGTKMRKVSIGLNM